MKKGLREKEGLIETKLQGREATTHYEKNVSYLRENEMLSPLWFTSCFPLTSVHLRGHLT